MGNKRGAKRVWERTPLLVQDYYTPDVMYYLENWAKKRPKFLQRAGNFHLDVDTKRAALKASHAVVALKSYTGEEDLYQCSGTIIETDDNNVAIALSSANLIRQPTEPEEQVFENSVANELKVVVFVADGKSYEGDICAFDFHLNMVAIRFKSDSALPAVKVRSVDDSTHLTIPEETPFLLHPHTSSFNLVPGTSVVAVGRHFTKPFDLMAAPGEFSLDRCEYDCKELFMATCSITGCGDGGPIVNLYGEMIGLAFYDISFTPFLPINVAFKWWERYKSSGELRRPSLGVEATNFYAADLDIAEKIIQKFPYISKGVIVEKVTLGSAAESAGLRLDDVIIRCSGKPIKSFLELLENIWDKVGDLVELEVARVNHDNLLHLKMLVAEVDFDNLNSWPCFP